MHSDSQLSLSTSIIRPNESEVNQSMIGVDVTVVSIINNDSGVKASSITRPVCQINQMAEKCKLHTSRCDVV